MLVTYLTHQQEMSLKESKNATNIIKVSDKWGELRSIRKISRILSITDTALLKMCTIYRELFFPWGNHKLFSLCSVAGGKKKDTKNLFLLIKNIRQPFPWTYPRQSSYQSLYNDQGSMKEENLNKNFNTNERRKKYHIFFLLALEFFYISFREEIYKKLGLN